MRRLNQSSRKNRSTENKLRWCDYQQAEVDRIGVPELKTAFPGSMLCNHILVPASSEVSANDVGFALPDVSHVVYAYCDGNVRKPQLENSLVVDIDGQIDHDNMTNIVAAVVKAVDVSRVVLVGSAAYLRFGEDINRVLGERVEVQVLEPDWLSWSAMHDIYRQASATLFINTMRVLDAVATGCNASLVADREFRQQPAFAVLHHCLKSTGCEIYDESGVADSAMSSAMLSYHVVENSVQAVQTALRKNTTDDLQNHADEDWFVNLNVEPTVPVINPYCSSRNRTLSGLRDRKTSAARKMVKLWDDPGAFFLDSQYRMLRLMGRVFQNKTANI